MTNNCINDLLKIIYLLQNSSINNYDINNCLKPYLGNIENNLYNTRPISIYTKNGSLFSIDYNDSNISVFKVEKIKDNTLTLKPLINNEGNLELTNNSIKINTNCIYAIRCLDDVFINNT